ncbi:competence type IV pilus major pilin ComGC [Evansella sp. AB-rgal1]|uniref:competence type IV pilus major pilin ComGC n=1 Tax=Evansella sp. AB-rgal1 TaxID=3242696 RepID=UPI00359EE064
MNMIKKFLTKWRRNESGFTLIEMMIVLVIISTLLLIAVPNLSKNQDLANNKGCEATKDLIRAQLISYEIEKNIKVTDLEVLVTEEYVDTIICPNSSTKLTLADLSKKR